MFTFLPHASRLSVLYRLFDCRCGNAGVFHIVQCWHSSPSNPAACQMIETCFNFFSSRKVVLVAAQKAAHENSSKEGLCRQLRDPHCFMKDSVAHPHICTPSLQCKTSFVTINHGSGSLCRGRIVGQFSRTGKTPGSVM